MSTYLITGIAGFIGSSLARAVLQRGGRVRGIDNFSTGKAENIAEIIDQIDFREADLLDWWATQQACRDVDYVLHEAAIPSVPRSKVGATAPCTSSRDRSPAEPETPTGRNRAKRW